MWEIKKSFEWKQVLCCFNRGHRTAAALIFWAARVEQPFEPHTAVAAGDLLVPPTLTLDSSANYTILYRDSCSPCPRCRVPFPWMRDWISSTANALALCCDVNWVIEQFCEAHNLSDFGWVELDSFGPTVLWWSEARIFLMVFFFFDQITAFLFIHTHLVCRIQKGFFDSRKQVSIFATSQLFTCTLRARCVSILFQLGGGCIFAVERQMG